MEPSQPFLSCLTSDPEIMSLSILGMAAHNHGQQEKKVSSSKNKISCRRVRLDYTIERCCIQLLVSTFLSSISCNHSTASQNQIDLPSSRSGQIGQCCTLHCSPIWFPENLLFRLPQSWHSLPWRKPHLSQGRGKAWVLVGGCSAARGGAAHVSPTVWLPKC